jgi:hypothetical protein
MLAREGRGMALTVALLTFLASAIVLGGTWLFVGREKGHEVLRGTKGRAPRRSVT